jgi:hypothetical protein
MLASKFKIVVTLNCFEDQLEHVSYFTRCVRRSFFKNRGIRGSVGFLPVKKKVKVFLKRIYVHKRSRKRFGNFLVRIEFLPQIRFANYYSVLANNGVVFREFETLCQKYFPTDVSYMIWPPSYGSFLQCLAASVS